MCWPLRGGSGTQYTQKPLKIYRKKKNLAIIDRKLTIIDRKTSFCHSRKPLALIQSKKQLIKRNLVVIMGKRSKKNFFTTILAPNCDEDFILAS
jgi:hypothetical protein